jgi:cobalt/nickel transport system permease protein
LHVLSDRHVAGTSFLHRLDPRAKLLLTLAFIFAAILTPTGRWDVFACLAAFFAVALAASRLPVRLVFGRSLLALPFVLAAVPVLFNHPGDALFSLPLFGWTATDQGLEAMASIFCRSWLAVLAATILTATTEADRILRALSWFGVPRLLVATISFMWRYVFVIVEEVQRLLRARESRSARVSKAAGGRLAWRAQVAGNMVGSLFLRTLDRSDRIYVAMQARGYDGTLLSLQRFRWRPTDLMTVAASLAVLIAVVGYGRTT